MTWQVGNGNAGMHSAKWVPTGGLATLLLVALFCWTILPVHADDAAPNTQQTQMDNRIADEMVLSELNHLANALEQERKFNRILLKKIDDLTKRLGKLEAKLDGTAKNPDEIQKELSEQSRLPQAETKPEGMDKTPVAPQSDGKEPKVPVPQDDLAKKDKGWSEEFEQFLDMGEAMLRRFFGVVKDFRQEFEENRA